MLANKTPLTQNSPRPQRRPLTENPSYEPGGRDDGTARDSSR